MDHKHGFNAPILIFLLACGFVFEKINAQDPVYSQFMFNQVFFNPAFASSSENPRFSSGYRDQWPGLDNTYVSYYASYDQYIEQISGGIGVTLNRDVQGNGVFSNTGLGIMYSYPFEINSNVLVNLGLQASLIQNSLNTSGLVFPDQNPFISLGQTEVIPNQSKFYPDFSAGASILANEQYQISFAVHHLNTPNEMSGLTNVTLPMLFTVQVLSQFPARPEVKEDKTLVFFPGLMAQMQKEYVYLNYGSNLQYNQVIAGVWLRNDLLFHLNTFIFLAGYAWSGIHLTYSYDLWLPKTFQPGSIYGSHEVTFIYILKYKEPKKKKRALKCPNF